MGINPCYFRNLEDLPVEMVSYIDVSIFIEKLNELID